MSRVHIGPTIAESTPFPQPSRGRTSGPNVMVVVLDDLGFGQLGCFGSDIATPNIDALAAGGLRYNRFHVTAMCSPTRAALLTGRNHHAVGMGLLPEVAVRFPGYHSRMPRSAATVARHLRDAGYSTYAVGKWHLAPRDEWGASGPFDRWPLGMGFERYYGFLGGDTNQYTPELVCDNHSVEPSRSAADGYHLTEDLADRTIRMVQDQQQSTPGKPFFLYFATGAMHAPHQVGAEWIEPYRGAFDDGWDSWRARVFERQIASGVVPAETTLTARPSWVQEWNSLAADERRVYARMMEVFAGFLTHTDRQIGRIVDFLRITDVLDDTLVLLISDNGTSAEGGPYGSVNEHRFVHGLHEDLAENIAKIDELGGFRAYNHYAWGWAWAGNTPLRLWKRYTWLGGTRTPLVVHWPNGIDARGELRSQFCHAVDLTPTILDAARIEPAPIVDGVEQLRVDGASLTATFADAAVPAPRDTQYFELMGSRAIFHDGWKATTDHVGRQLPVEQELVEGSRGDFGEDRWLLFHIDEDFSEANDLAAAEPERVRLLVDRWWTEAGRNGVLPLDDTFIGRVSAMFRPRYAPRHRTVYRPGGGPVQEDLMPPLGAGFVATAAVDVGANGSPLGGILYALGNWTNGIAFYVKDGRLVHVFNAFGHPQVIDGPLAIGPGAHELSFAYDCGVGTLCVDGAEVARAEVAHTLPFRWQIGGAGLTIGYDRGFPVVGEYEPPFPFSATLHHVTFEIPALAPPDDTAARAEIAIALKSE
ncbi:MAG: arylsulfatase [Actinomycetota bacterium]